VSKTPVSRGNNLRLNGCGNKLRLWQFLWRFMYRVNGEERASNVSLWGKPFYIVPVPVPVPIPVTIPDSQTAVVSEHCCELYMMRWGAECRVEL
jgi:hypothetical protein